MPEDVACPGLETLRGQPWCPSSASRLIVHTASPCSAVCISAPARASTASVVPPCAAGPPPSAATKNSAFLVRADPGCITMPPPRRATAQPAPARTPGVWSDARHTDGAGPRRSTPGRHDSPSGALIDGSHYRGRHPNDTVKQTLRVTSTVDPTPRIRPSVLGPQPAVPDGGSVSVGPSKGPGSGRQGRSEPGRSADHRIGTRPPSPPPRAEPPLVGRWSACCCSWPTTCYH